MSSGQKLPILSLQGSYWESLLHPTWEESAYFQVPLMSEESAVVSLLLCYFSAGIRSLPSTPFTHHTPPFPGCGYQPCQLLRGKNHVAPMLTQLPGSSSFGKLHQVILFYYSHTEIVSPLCVAGGAHCVIMCGESFRPSLKS